MQERNRALASELATLKRKLAEREEQAAASGTREAVATQVRRGGCAKCRCGGRGRDGSDNVSCG